MQYTITSRGRPIGTTDLGFNYRPGSSRMGWFQPNADGERLMPTITAVSITTRTYSSNIGQAGESAADTEHSESMFLADVAEAAQHVEALDLELRREDGSVVPTEFINIQDMDELVAWSDKLEATRDGEGWKYCDSIADPLYDLLEDIFDEEFDDELEDFDDAEPPFDLESDDEMMFGDGFADTAVPWTRDDYEPDPSMRYQIYVDLVNPEEIP